MAYGPDYRAAHLGIIKINFVNLDNIMKIAHYFIKTEWQRVEVLPIHCLDALKAYT